MASRLDPHRAEIFARLADGDSCESIRKWLKKSMNLEITRQAIRKWKIVRLNRMIKTQALLGAVPSAVERAVVPAMPRASRLAADPFGQTVARAELQLAELCASTPFLVRASGAGASNDVAVNDEFDRARKKQK